MFDVTICSYDGAGTCELVGAYLIDSKLKERVGLHRDDGLVVCKATPREGK